MKKSMVLRSVATGLVVIGLFMASGCVATDTVSPRFPAVEANINAARTVGAAEYAPAPLALAEAKLEAARSAVKSGDMVLAARLVDEAMVDANHAQVLAPTEKAKIDAMKLRMDIQTLRDEIKKMSAVN